MDSEKVAKRRRPETIPNIWDKDIYPTLTNTKNPFTWEKGIFQRHLVMSSKEDIDLSNISHFKLAKELKKIRKH